MPNATAEQTPSAAQAGRAELSIAELTDEQVVARIAGFDWPYGSFARVARQFPSPHPRRKGKRLTAEAVRAVALGRNRNPKIARALLRERTRIEEKRAALAAAHADVGSTPVSAVA